jgi:hypothetical protein
MQRQSSARERRAAIAITSRGAIDHVAMRRGPAILMLMEGVLLRPLALPVEHGGWGFLLEPIILALLVAPSAPGTAIAIAAVAVFLARHPLRLAASDRLRHKRYPRTVACEQLALAYASAAVIAIAFANMRALAPFAIALPFAAFQFAEDASNRGHRLLPEIAGAIATSSIAASIALAGGVSIAFASTLALLTILRSIPSIVYVRSALGKAKRSHAVVLHVAAVIIAIALWQQHLAPLLAIIAMATLLVRAIVAPRAARAQTVGLREVAFGAVVVALIAIGYRM